MTLALLSNEMTLRRKLRELNCAETSFAAFNGVLGRTRFFEAMRGKPGKHLSKDQLQQLLEVISEMEILQAASPIDWSNTEKVRTALVIQRVNRIANELRHADELERIEI